MYPDLETSLMQDFEPKYIPKFSYENIHLDGGVDEWGNEVGGRTIRRNDEYVITRRHDWFDPNCNPYRPSVELHRVSNPSPHFHWYERGAYDPQYKFSTSLRIAP